MKVKVTRRSPITGELNTVLIEMTQDQIDRYKKNEEHIQHIFPNLSANEREFILTGMTPEDWDKTMKKIEKD